MRQLTLSLLPLTTTTTLLSSALRGDGEEFVSQREKDKDVEDLVWLCVRSLMRKKENVTLALWLE